MANAFTLGDFEKTMIEEISVLTDQPPLVVREILELTFLRQLDSYTSGEQISVPFLGKLKMIYKGDFLSGGERVADLDVLFAPSDLTRRIIGEIEDGTPEIIRNLLGKKVENELRTILEK